MSLETINDQVLNCEVKDATGLNDFQRLPAEDQIGIPRVGVNRFRIPLKFPHPQDPGTLNHDCEASMFINLRKGKTGINMSRLCQILINESEGKVIDYKFLTKLINLYKKNLRDSDDEKEIDEILVKLDFMYPLKQRSLKSDNWGWQYYKCSLEVKVENSGEPQFFLTVNFEYSSTCPCSLSMSRQYERDFKDSKITEGSGIATAHSQRSGAKCKVHLTTKAIDKEFFIDDLVKILRIALPTETQSLVKRADEQAFAILNGSNPMFVEHASKRVFLELEEHGELIRDWSCHIEHWESLHSHNAAALIYKGIPNGLRA